MINLTKKQIEKEIALLTKDFEGDEEITYTVNLDEEEDTQVYLNIYADGEYFDCVIVAEVEAEGDSSEVQRIVKRICKTFNAKIY